MERAQQGQAEDKSVGTGARALQETLFKAQAASGKAIS